MNRTSVPVVIALLLAAVTRPVHAELVDAVAATVDKEVILYSDLMLAVGNELDKLRQSATSQQEYNQRANQLLKDALDQAIENRLLLREARKFPQFAVDDQDLDAYMKKIRERYANEEAFVKEVGSVSEFRERQRELLQAQRMAYVRRQNFEDEVVVTDQDIAQYYEDHKEDFEHPERVYVRQIFLRVNPPGDEQARQTAHAKLEVLRDEIEAGADFADLAKVHSEGPSAQEGGAIGWQRPGDLIEPLDNAVFSLSEGAVSQVIDSPRGVHLLKVDKREDAGAVPLDEVRLQIEPILRQQAAQERYETWLNDLRKRSRVRIFL